MRGSESEKTFSGVLQVKTRSHKLKEDRKQTFLKPKWEVGLIFYFLKSKSHQINYCYRQFLHLVLNVSHTLDFCLHTTLSSSKAIKGPSAHGGDSKAGRREAQRQLLVECTSHFLLREHWAANPALPSVLSFRSGDSEGSLFSGEDSALQSADRGTSTICALPTGIPATSKERSQR